jgi:hypothetical protein
MCGGPIISLTQISSSPSPHTQSITLLTSSSYSSSFLSSPFPTIMLAAFTHETSGFSFLFFIPNAITISIAKNLLTITLFFNLI